MSRIPPPRSPLKAPSTPVKTRPSGPTSRTRTQTSARATTPTKPAAPSASQNQEAASASLSLKEAIALKRAEAKKIQAKATNNSLNDFIPLEDAALPATKQEDEDILGRWPIRETIERARSTGITPDPLPSVPNEPALPPPTPDAPRRGGRKEAPAWFEAQDLTVLKAWNNEIVEIQHEISLFGSLKTLDLHKNKLASLPIAFADLTALTNLDLSYNSLTSLPANLFALPELTSLNISNNALTSLPFNAPFHSRNGTTRTQQTTGGSFFTPTITRATTPLPRLAILDASHNQISVTAIDLEIPAGLTKLDLSANPLGSGPRSRALLQALGGLQRLKELRFETADISDEALPSALFSAVPFPALRILDFGQTKVTQVAAKEALKNMKQEFTFNAITDDPPPGIACIIIGKRVVREAWELELEQRQRSRIMKQPLSESGEDVLPTSSSSRPKVEGVKKPTTAVREDWEIEAEQGLLTEGGKRRARAAAAAAAASSEKSSLDVGVPSVMTPKHSPKSSTSGLSLSSPQYYDPPTQTLTLPPSNPLTKFNTHARAFSLAAPSSFSVSTPSRTADLGVPAPTLPLSIIINEPFAHKLKNLILVNRRMDKSFSLLSVSDNLLPNLEELNLEGCGLPDLVTTVRSDPDSGNVTPPRSTEPILPLIARLFPSLQTLNLSYNALTSASLPSDSLSALILATSDKKGLRHLRLRGNRLGELDGFQGIAESFKGNREVPGWKLDELDLRDNEINKIPPEVGLLPMDVFLVDGNTFRVPPRRVWEREGTKGLLSWLRGRIE